MSEIKIQKWQDGEDMICANCEKPIYVGEKIIRTETLEPSKRDVIHEHVCYGKEQK
jgi:hypothetical protein